MAFLGLKGTDRSYLWLEYVSTHVYSTVRSYFNGLEGEQMGKLTTAEVAEHMVKKGGFYTAQKLGRELGITAKNASGKLCNIRKCRRFITEETPLPNRTVKIKKIRDSEFIQESLWDLAIGNRRVKAYGV